MTTTNPAPDPLGAFLGALADALAERLRPLLAGGSTPTPAGPEAPLTYSQAARVAGIPASALRRAAALGALAVVRVGVRTVRICPADLAHYLERRRSPARDEAGGRARVTR